MSRIPINFASLMNQMGKAARSLKGLRPRMPKGALNKAKYVGKRGLQAAGAGLGVLGIYDVGADMFGSSALSDEEKKLLEDEMMSALGSDPIGQEMYQQQLLSNQLSRMRELRQRIPMTSQEASSQIRASELTRMLQDHEENLMRNALTESQIQQSSAFAPNYSDLVNQLDRRYMP
jgi:hypothetical protein